MRLTLVLACLLGLLPTASAGPAGRAEIEADLALKIALETPDVLRAGQPIQTSAVLANLGKKRSHLVVRPGNGCEWGIVEPHVFYTARVQAEDGSWKDVAARKLGGMCGMGDYRWQQNVVALEPGGRIDFSDRLSTPGLHLHMPAAGLVELRLHYAWKRKGTRERLPTGDPVGDLGPMKDVPVFEIVSNPVTVRIRRPIEIVAAPTGAKQAKSGGRLSDHLRCHLENWSGEDLSVDSAKLRVTVEVRPAGAAKQRVRKPLTIDADFESTVEDGGKLPLLGPEGVHDEYWVRKAEAEPVEVSVVVRGIPGTSEPLRSAWVALKGL